jgi:hypothetical protein
MVARPHPGRSVGENGVPEAVVAAAQRAERKLLGARHDIEQAVTLVPATAGLYAVWPDEEAWAGLGLRPASDSQPIYIGKSESSLRGREVNTHFDAGQGTASKTGSSTVRRSFAALLAPSLGLRAIPRNVEKPGYFSNYSLRAEDDLRLTQWMHAHLQLSTWSHDTLVAEPLGDIESLVIRSLDPPLNIDKAPSTRSHLKVARAALARKAASFPS